MRDLMERIRRSFGRNGAEDRLADALTELHEALKYAEASGKQFTPEAKLARTALRAIAWR